MMKLRLRLEVAGRCVVAWGPIENPLLVSIIGIDRLSAGPIIGYKYRLSAPLTTNNRYRDRP